MKSILQQMYDYHYGNNLEDADVKELEKTARMVLEDGCPLTVAELAKVFITADATKTCPFCDKADWGFWDWHGVGDHMHDDDCPFAVAYAVLTPKQIEDVASIPLPSSGIDATSAAKDLAQSLKIDGAVRVVAKSGKNHDTGPNWYAEWGGMQISATFGAGTNSAYCQALVGGETTILYSGSEYGRDIETFRTGPWVNRILARADELRKANKIARREQMSAEYCRKLDNFREVDF